MRFMRGKFNLCYIIRDFFCIIVWVFLMLFDFNFDFIIEEKIMMGIF